MRSGRDVDKWKEMNLTPVPSLEVKVPSIAESPVNIECRVHHVEELGSHHMFVAEVVAVQVDDAYMYDKKNVSGDTSRDGRSHDIYLSESSVG